MRIRELEPKFIPPQEVQFGEIIQEGCFPPNAYLATNRIEFFYTGGKWQLPLHPRMDSVVKREKERLEVVEMNKLKIGDSVVLGSTENGSEGIYVTNLRRNKRTSKQFGFMASDTSRERRLDYSKLAGVLDEAKDGKIVWVLGPAVVHAGGIESMEWLVRHGYVGALLGGNAVAAHDIEHAIYGTSLGMGDNCHTVKNGHRKHLEAINAVRTVGSIGNAIKRGLFRKGIMYECYRNDVPVVLAGSIRDDGPLPDTITDALESQDAMREHVINASCVITLATTLHSIATGNMTPTYRIVGDEIREVPMICVDSVEFSVNKLVDRGTSQAYPVIANARDFLSLLVNELGKQHHLGNANRLIGTRDRVEVTI